MRTTLGLALALAFVVTSLAPVAAQSTTGTLSGTVTDSNGKRLANVVVTAVSPSSRYSATTDAQGFFGFPGVSADTYTVTFTLSGFETATINGVTVAAGQTETLNESLSQRLQRIGRTAAHSVASAFQPLQTQDTYTVNTQQIDTILGQSNANNEANLLAAIPGASFDILGYPVLRGGRENEEGFQFEGIPYTDAFTNQFVNGLILNGAAQFQVTPGAGDASNGNAGTGSINIIAKRGTNPAFGSAEYQVYSGINQHNANAEYGFATPNGRFSNYTSYQTNHIGAFQYGPRGTPSLLLGDYFGRNNQWANDFVENAVYKFGPNHNQSLQFFWENGQLDIHLGNAFQFGPNGQPLNLNGQTLFYKINDPFYLFETSAFTGLSVAQIQSLQQLTIGQAFLTQPIGSRFPFNDNEPNDTFKLQYSISPNASTFLTMKAYEVNQVELFDIPYNATAVDGGDIVSLQGGMVRGATLDGTIQLNSKHLLGFGADMKYLHPVFSQPSGSGGLYDYAGFGLGYEAADFLPNDANCPLGPGACGYLLGNNPTGTQYIAPGTRLPYANEGTTTNRTDYGFYVQDTWSPTDRLRANVGLRLDHAVFHMPQCTIDTCLPTSTSVVNGQPVDQFNYDQSTRTPWVLQPRISIADQFTRYDSLRVAYQRSVQFPLLSQIDVSNDQFGLYKPYVNVPSFDVLTGGPAQFCGTTFDRPCKNYADQLYWANQANFAGVPIQPLKPVTFNNWELTYSHQFPHQVAMKVTPFYRKAYNEIAQVQQPIVVNGVPQFNPGTGAPILGPPTNTNLGSNQITGVEFLVTKEAPFGLSGQFSLTYQNAFSNVLPLSASEDFFPSVPLASLQLGNQYRVGYLSPLVGQLSLSYRTRNGWRINPSLYYNHGYPLGVGLLAPFTVNGVPANIPNTNVTNSGQLGGANGANAYVDPQNPGSLYAPVIAATRGVAQTASPGGALSKAQLFPANITVEFTPPRNPRMTFGVLVANIFNNYYGNSPATTTGPNINARYIPVATGRGAPFSGYSSLATNPSFIGFYNYTDRHGNLPYLFAPAGIGRTAEFYVQAKL